MSGTTLRPIHPETAIKDQAALKRAAILNAAPNVNAYETAKIGDHVAFEQGVTITLDANSSVGDFARLATGVVLEERSSVGKGVTLGRDTRVEEDYTIGAYCMIGERLVIRGDLRDFMVWETGAVRPRPMFWEEMKGLKRAFSARLTGLVEEGYLTAAQKRGLVSEFNLAWKNRNASQRQDNGQDASVSSRRPMPPNARLRALQMAAAARPR